MRCMLEKSNLRMKGMLSPFSAANPQTSDVSSFEPRDRSRKSNAISSSLNSRTDQRVGSASATCRQCRQILVISSKFSSR